MVLKGAPETGRFITLEGGEGAGKSTQAAALAAFLRGRGIDVLVTREPGGSPNAEQLRALLLAGRFAGLGPDGEAMAFALARADHMAHTIRPALAAGRWVITDRFMDSTRAYQGSSAEGSAVADPALLDLLDAIAVGETRPDLTLILDLPVAEGLRRASARGAAADRFERDSTAIHEARRATFLAIAAREPQRCVVIPAGGDAAGVTAEICDTVEERLL